MKRSIRRALVTSAILALVSAPALLEQHGRAAALSRLSRCSDGNPGCGGAAAIDASLAGLHLEAPWLVRRGWRLGGRSVRVGVDWSGVRVQIDDPSLARADPPRTAQASTDADARAPGRSLPNIRVMVTTRGDLVLADTPIGTLAARDLVLVWRPKHPVALQGEGSIEHPRGRVDTIGPMRAQVWLSGPRRLTAQGAISLGGGAATAMTVRASERDLFVSLEDAAGGELELEARDRGKHVGVETRGFALAHLGAWAQTMLPSAIDLSDATLDGGFELERVSSSPPGVRAHLRETTLTGLRLEHAKLSRVPVVFDALTAHGDLSLRPAEQQAQLTITHRGAQVHLAGTKRSEHIEVTAELPRLGCQTLLDAIPEGMTGVLAGTRVAGEVDGALSLSLSLTALSQARRVAETERDDPPGRLALSFDPLGRCSVLDDGPQIDLGSLQGPYRHRFVDARGHAHERVLATGAKHHVRLSQVPRLARAFTALEDSRFWVHDGFDPEQIERAFWHNLVAGRVSRGASTITQQLARMLWLGIDRSLARKLQEAVLAHRLEQTLDKKRILELYLNIIELGPGVHGVAEAAEHYFGKPAAALETIEALHIASLAPAPRVFAERFASGEVDDAWMEELHRHARRLHLYGHVTTEDLLQSLRARLPLRVRE